MDTAYRCVKEGAPRCSDLKPLFVRKHVADVAHRKDPKVTEQNRKNAERDFDRDEARNSRCTP